MKQQLAFLSVAFCLLANAPMVCAGDDGTEDSSKKTPTRPAPATVDHFGANSPQQVYTNYRQAIFGAQNVEQLEPFLARKRVAKLREARGIPAADVIGLIRSTEPKTISSMVQKINGDTATLELTAADSGALGDELAGGIEKVGKGLATAFGAKPSAKKQPSVTTGVVKLVREDGVWKIDEEAWSTRVGPPPKAPTPQETWAFCAGKAEFPKTPAAGKIHGAPFRVEKAELEGNSILNLSQGKEFFADREFMIFLFNDKKASLENRSFILPSDSGPHCHMKWKPKADGLPETKMMFGKEFGMRLQFGRRMANGLLPGYIVLRVPDAEGSYVQGYFYAKSK